MATAIPLQRNRTISGVLRFDGSEITYFFQPSGSVSLPVAEIVLVGDYTVESDPDDLFGENHFLVFVRGDSDEWLEVPMDAAGHEEVLEQLSAVWSAELRTGIAMGAGFASRIMWPPQQSGKPLFAFKPVKGVGFRGKLKLLLMPEVSHDLSPEALGVIGNKF